ncbi:LamG-like jellyroll fold domain-containing protein [Maribellus sp. YY47]|uniref:LamG-like jellyroll fold domain-containing protein n=1 Tax=Maribellus sp. YY47 TaxID=2929486 RepID=UPI0020017F1A|nr:LamG-like jellyroll fold domain-containing protein [Maribellus sp. YY47]MCK3686337.1 T9SS type A sorting domain-containing protein [Maribellus sp. YY47]
MRRFIYLLIWLLLPAWLSAQTNISAVEYWYDGDYSKASRQTVSAPIVNYTDLLDVSTLEPGLHTFSVRFQDNRGIWSSVLTKFFTYYPGSTPGIRQVTDVEYWYDGSYSTSVVVPLSPGASVDLNSLLDVSSLTNGLHTVSCRFKDDRGIWSSPLIRFFKKDKNTGLQQLVALEYWFNNDFNNKQDTVFTATSLLNLHKMLDVSSLNIGFHFVSFRMQDEQGKWGPVASWYFTKENQEDLPELHQLTALEYWFNGDYSTVQNDPVPATPLLNIDTDLDVSALNDGLHMLSCRYQDEAGNWSPAFSRLFAKFTAEPAPAMHNLLAVEYWIDGNISASVKTSVTPGSQYILDSQLDVSALNNGLHFITYRFQDEAGKWSSGTTHFFSKHENEIVTANNKITNYRYWVDDLIESAIEVDLTTPLKSLNLDEVVDVSPLPGGTHDISFQFRDSLGLWSSAYTESFSRDFNPRGTITAETDPACSNSAVTFTAETMDVDSIYWDFGDTTAIVGRAASEDAYHAYTNAGTYTITATLVYVDSAYTSTASTSVTVNQSYGVSLVAPENLIAYYPFDGNATDASGNGHDGTVSGATLTEDRNGTPNSAYLFDGNDGILVQHSDELNMSGALSFSCWIKPDLLQNAMIFGKSNYTTATNYLLRIQSDGNLQWEYNGYLNTTSQPLEAGKWCHIAVTANNPGEHRKVYVNGQLAAETTSSSGPFGSITNPLTFGYASRNAEYFKGAIDEIKMFNKELSAAEVFQEFSQLPTTMLPPIETEICANDTPYVFGSQLLTQSGTYYETYPTVNGCDSVVQLNLTVHPTYNDTIGDPLNALVMDDFESDALGTLPDGWVIRYNGTGDANQKVVESPVKNGVHSFQLSGSGWAANLSKSVPNMPDTVILEGWMQTPNVSASGATGIGIGNPSIGTWGTFLARVEFYGGNLTAINYSGGSGTRYILQSAVSDTWYHIKIVLNQTGGTYEVYIDGEQSEGAADGQTYTDFPAIDVTPTSIELWSNSLGYFDDVKMYESGSTAIVICSSETPYAFGTQQLTQSGTYTEIFQSQFGCDSTVTLNLTVYPSFLRKDTVTICENELPYQWEDSTLLAAGTYTQAYTTVNGCDSILNFTLNVTDTSLIEQTLILCENDLPHLFGTQTLTSSGTFTEVFTGSNGCDSTVVLTLNVLDTSLVAKKVTICENDLPFQFGSQVLSADGIYTETFSSVNGCDSTVTVSLTVYPVYSDSVNVTVGISQLPYLFGDQQISQAGIYTQNLQTANGCDSIIILKLKVNDDVPPVVTCNNLEVTISEDGTYLLTTDDKEQISFGTQDNITLNENLDIQVVPSSFSCANLGENNATLTVKDEAGNTASCQATITVWVEKTDPMMDEIPDVILQEDDSSVVILTGISGGTICGPSPLSVQADHNNTDLLANLSIDHQSFDTTATLKISLKPDQFGTDSIVVSVTDTFGAVTSRKFLLTVIPVNDSPYLLSPASDQAMKTNDTLDLTFNKNEWFADVDDNTLTFETATVIGTLPDWIQTDQNQDTYSMIFMPTSIDTGCVDIVVTASDQNGEMVRDTFEVCVTLLVGIREIDGDHFGINLYPNPTKGPVTIDLKNPLPGEVKLIVMNIAGREVIRKTYQSNEQMIFDISDKPSGAYLVILETNDIRMVRKLILDKK